MVDKRLKYILYFLMIISLFLSIKNRVNASEITQAVKYVNGQTKSVAIGNGTYAGISIKYNTSAITDSPEKISYYINNNDHTNYKYVSGFLRIEEPSNAPIIRPIILYMGSDCVVNDSIGGNTYLIGWTCENNGSGWLDILNQFPYGITSIYVSRYPTYSQSLNTSNDYTTAINTISNNSQNTANNTYYIKEGITDTNNTLKDSNVDTSNADSTFSNLNSNMASNGTISSLLLMPITLLQKILNAMSGTCSAINTGQLLGEDFILPCISIPDLIGSGLWSVIDVIGSGALAYAIGKKFIKIFNQFTNLKEGGLESAYD